MIRTGLMSGGGSPHFPRRKPRINTAEILKSAEDSREDILDARTFLLLAQEIEEARKEYEEKGGISLQQAKELLAD